MLPRSSRTRLLAVTLVAAALSVGVAAPLAAQGAKVAIIDTERILLSSATGKEALDGLKALREQKEKEGETRTQELQGLQQRLQEGRLSLSEDKLAELQQQIEDKTIQMRRFQDDANRELNKKQEEVLAAVDRKVMPVIVQYGKANGYDLIFRKFESGLVYAADGVDVTDEIIKQLDGGS